ncbi:unnamed protein product [Spirodela intermedia]|uniref:Glycosyltransferase n=1 Tax=Spirodela intermedia TaxID=51605 RepID=A0A7I8L9N3_SPIIN|nr:unnamed protein product [Spirodela intermedia]
MSSPKEGEVLVVPFHSKGHTFPAIELSHHLAARGLSVTLFLPSLPSSPLHDIVTVHQFAAPPPPPPTDTAAADGHPSPSPPPHLHRDPAFEEYLSRRSGASPPLLCAIVDVMMSSYIPSCDSLGVPVVSFFTSSGCAAALEHAASKLSEEDLGPEGTLAVPGLPEDMALTASDLRQDPPPHGGPSLPWGPSDGGSAPPFWPPPPHGSPPSPRGHSDGGSALPFWPPPPPQFQQGHFPSRPPPQQGAAPPPPLMPPCADGVPVAQGGGRGPQRGLGETSRVAALLFNTCDAVERPFLEYIAKESGKPVWGVGPLLPSRFWSTADEPVGDEAARPEEQREFGVADGEIRAWLDAKPPASVVYISFGTLVGPADEELEELAAALEESRRPFIWVLQAGPMGPGGPPGGGGGYFPEDLARQAEESQRGLVIRGWAPQLMILSHPSTGAFLSHCGWNSTVEALAKGVPILAWPIKGDQVSNSKLVTARLRVGYPVRTASPDPGERVTRRDVTRGIERLMADDGVKERAAAVRSIFDAGFPRSSAGSLDAFVDFLGRNLEPLGRRK